MVKSYCVKEKIMTESLPGSEKLVRTIKKRVMLKSTCALCGNSKTRFIRKTKIFKLNQY